MISTSFIGRESELSTLERALDEAIGGRGSALIVSGEPGIGKSRLVEQCLDMARRKGMTVLLGSASQDSAEPVLVFSKALGRLSDEPLLAETETVSFAGVFLASKTGEIITRVMRGRMDPESIANALDAVQSFVGDSFRDAGGSIGRMTFGSMTILAERSSHGILCGIAKGSEHPEMARCLKSVAKEMELAKSSPDEAVARLAEMKFTMRKDISGVKLASERNKLADKALSLLSRATGDAPVLMIFEDMHWADEVSLYVFSYLARISSRLRLSIIATSRPSESEIWDKEVDNLTTGDSVKTLLLVRMDERGVRALVDASYSPNNFPDDFYSRLARDCDGNPLFTVEMVTQMVVEGSVSKVDGAYTVVERNFTMPQKVEDIVLKRLEGINPEALSLAEQSSCAGREFPMGMIKDFANVAEPESTLSALEALGILSTSGDTVQFRHAMFREAIYRNISGRWRATYHRGIGEYYEKAYGSDQGQVIYELARHFYHSNEKAKAFGYCYRAGEQAEGSFAAERAIEFYRWAMDALSLSKISPMGEKEVDLLERMGDLQILVSQYHEAISTFSTAILKSDNMNLKALFHRKKGDAYWKLGMYDESLEEVTKGEALTDDPLERIMLGHQRAYILMRRGEYEQAITMCNDLLARLSAMPDVVQITASVYDTIASSSHRKGDHALALEYYDKCLKMSESLGDLRKMGALYNNIGNVYGDRLQNDLSRQYYDKSMEIFKKIGDKQAVGVILGNVGAIYQSKGDVTTAMDYYSKSLRMAEEIGDSRMISASLGNSGVVYFSLGDFHLCIETFERAMKIWVKMGDQNGQSWGLASIGASHLEMGDYEKALEYLRKGFDLSEKIDDQWKLCGVCLHMGELMRCMGQYDSARSNYQRTFEMAKALDSMDLAIDALTGLTEADLVNGDFDAASEHIAQAEKIATDSGLNVELSSALRAHGSLLAATGKPVEAESKFLESMGIHAHINIKIGKAKLLYEWGNAAIRWGETERGMNMVNEARTTFSGSDMRVWIEKCDRILNGTS